MKKCTNYTSFSMLLRASWIISLLCRIEKAYWLVFCNFLFFVHYPFAEQKLDTFATCEESLAENRALWGAACQTQIPQIDQQLQTKPRGKENMLFATFILLFGFLFLCQWYNDMNADQIIKLACVSLGLISRISF